MQKKGILPTIKSYTYTRILPIMQTNAPAQVSIPPGKELQQPIAVICDLMTWKNLRHEHHLISLTPQTWHKILDKRSAQKVKFFFCESAWSGIENACWRGQIYKDERVFHENRRELLKILDVCKSDKIPTVFWAKEDPVYFQDPIYNFTDTALRFDYILTTAEECIKKYRALGHNHTHLWTFGFSPKIYHPPDDLEKPREPVAVFAGSWYTDHPRRCADLSYIFDMLSSAGIPFRIYDRHRALGYSTKPFPDKYQPYVQDAVSYKELGNIYRSVKYAINVNTISDSATMFARRVYEIMACGCIVVSNESVGMRRQFNNRIWFAGDNFDFDNINHLRKVNIDTVFAEHTVEQRMQQLYTLIGCES